MILQALYDYYTAKSHRGEIAPEGFSLKGIDFLIILDQEGNYIDIESLQTIQKKRSFGKPFWVPTIGKQVERHSNAGNDANLLWDNSEFVLGIGKKGKIKFNSFIETIESYYPEPPKDIQAVLKYLSKEKSNPNSFSKLSNHKEYGEQLSSGKSIISFRIGSSRPIITEEHVKKALNNKRENSEVLGTCLITGEQKVPIELTHTPTKGVKGSQTSGANLISFNKQSFISFNKKKSLNAPVSKRAAAGYTKALQHLINSNINRVRIADATIIFWAERVPEIINPVEILPWVIAAQKTDEDNPDKGVHLIESLYNSIYTGNLVKDKTNHFYLLGLAPNAARISVRFWKAPSVVEFGKNIIKHFNDFEIVHREYEPKYLPLYQILSSITLETKKRDKPNVIFFRGKYYDVLPNLSGQIIESIIDGSQYPPTLLQQCLIRIRAEAAKKDKNGKTILNVTYTRAAILKAHINRFNRIHKQSEKEITMALDSTNNNVAYRIGRLFAVLEKIQERANPGINTTIRDRFYGAASSTPVTVFPRLLSLKNAHLKKLSTREKIYYEKLIGEIMCEISSFPTNLSLNDQAHFAIGYYHQRQDFFTSKLDKSKTETINNQLAENKHGNN